jgi:hypothetical protein
MSVRFDVRAALAEIKRQSLVDAPPAKAATPAIEDRPAPGAAATAAKVDVEEYEERAAIAEYDGGLSRDEAEAAAAQAQGFADPAILREAAAHHWAQQLEDLALRQDFMGRHYIKSARQFVADGWAEQALAAGWSEIELFGLCPVALWARFDRMGAAWLGPVKAVTGETIGYVTGNRIWRGRVKRGSRMPW